MEDLIIEGVTIKECKEGLELEVVFGEEYLERIVTRPMLSRPGVEIHSNNFQFYERDRIQILGSKEIFLFELLSKEERQDRAENLFRFNPPAFIFTRNVSQVPQEFIEASKKYHIPILRSYHKTTSLIGNLTSYLAEEITESKTMHGVMLDVYSIGVLITGKSFVGKSETALELLKRGHTLIADDRVDVIQKEIGVLFGKAPKLIQRLMEVRGIGIVDVVHLFGVGAFRPKKRINLIVNLVKWDESFNYNRLNLEEETEQIFDTFIPKVTIPVKPGRNLATLIEIATMNYRAKHLGYNAGVDFANKIDNLVKRGGKDA